MDFYEAIRKRRTVREFLDKDVDFEAIKRILETALRRLPERELFSYNLTSFIS